MADHFIAFWNVENLFAPEGFAGREPWMAKELRDDLAGWTQALFETKLDQLTLIIRQMNGGAGPDILGVCEIENAFVLERLIARLNLKLATRQYNVAHVDSTLDQRGIDTAFIFDQKKYKVDREKIFSHFVLRRTGTRDITQVTFTTQSGNDLIALCNHWPARIPGVYESRGYRIVAGETLSYWHQRIWEEKGNTVPIIAMGDFNDNPFDDSLQVHAQAIRERGDVERARDSASFYNLAWRYLEQEGKDKKGSLKQLHGTLYYQGEGHLFDQILVSKGLLIPDSPIRVSEQTARIELFPEMVAHSVAEGPIRFGLPKGNAKKNTNIKGFSDHFPVSVILQEK
ncbi:MAG: endonuclease/exonuclease/phosphatase family protein [Nitrospirota bacterium]